MSRLESIFVGLFVGIACPLLTFSLFWWAAAVVHMQLSQVTIQAVITAALTGLALGIILDIVYLKRWIKVFYTASIWILTVIYLGLCVVAVAFFMGLPIGSFFLGIVASIYTGRRQHHAQADSTSATPALQKTALFASLVTTTAVLPIGFLALDEQSVLMLLERLLGFSQVDSHGFAGLTLVGVLCFVLFVVQYWCSRLVGQLAFTADRNDAQLGATTDYG